MVSNHAIGTDTNYDGGGAIDNYGLDSYDDDTLILDGSILAENTAASGEGPEIWMEDGTLNATDCLIGNGTTSFLTNGVNGNLVGTGSSPIDARLAPLGRYGGPTQTLAPLVGSPAIDAGDDSVTNFLTTDQRGYPRVSGGAVDIGAIEAQSAPTNIPPVLETIAWSNVGDAGGFRFSFTNAPHADFSVLMATNVALPLTDWMTMGEAIETSAGQYQFTDATATNASRRFYGVVSP